MVARPGTGQLNVNAGEMSPEVSGRVDIKQYYSAGLRFLNTEPIAQGGYRNMAGTYRVGLVGTATAPRFWRLKRSRTESFLVGLLPGHLDIFKDLTRVAQVSVPEITSDIQEDATLYLEGDTIGIFHRDLGSKRVLRIADDNWTVDNWPYQGIPDVDYGGVYAKTDDVWTIYIRWAENRPVVLQAIVDGETTAGAALAVDAADASPAQWDTLAAGLQTAIRDLPSFGPGVTVTNTAGTTGANGERIFTVVFGGDYTGVEYEFSAQVISSSEVAALAVHSQIGETAGEPAISDSRGWPGVVTIVQDRLCYAALGSRPSALLFSQTAEYFNVNIKTARTDGAKLEAIRTVSAEEILSVYEGKYLLVFTDEAEYFATNRAISRDEPSNFLRTGENKLARGSTPFEIENRIYYPGQPPENDPAAGGNVLFSTAYDDISQAFTSRAESLLAPHLVETIVETAIQRGTNDTQSTRLWLRRADGRLVGASIIRDQDITAFFEYAVGAPIRSVGVDAQNRLWLTVERPDGLTYEILNEGSYLFSSVPGTSNAAGIVSGLHYPDNTTVWVETAAGFVEGPFTVTSGAIQTPYASTTMTVGLWFPPRWESMPRVLVTGDNRIIRRPGRIHTLDINIIETTSIAVGANGGAPKDVSLLRTTDPVDAPMPPKTELVTVAGIDGFMDGTTAVVTQVRPGPLHVRDITFGEKL